MSAEIELRSRSILVGFVGGAVVGALLVGLAVIAAGGGHGSYVPAIVLFPYLMALAVPLGSIAPPLVGLAILQYPAYGVFWGISARGPRRGAFLLAGGGMHILAVCLALVLAMGDSNFWLG